MRRFLAVSLLIRTLFLLRRYRRVPRQTAEDPPVGTYVLDLTPGAVPGLIRFVSNKLLPNETSVAQRARAFYQDVTYSIYPNHDA